MAVDFFRVMSFHDNSSVFRRANFFFEFHFLETLFFFFENDEASIDLWIFILFEDDTELVLGVKDLKKNRVTKGKEKKVVYALE